MELANVSYFGDKANRLLGVNPAKYTSQQLINIEFLCTQVRALYNQIHQPKSFCRLPLSSRFGNTGKLVVDKGLVDTALGYLQGFNKVCQCQCACSWDCACPTCPGQGWDCNCYHCPGWPKWNDSDCSGECVCQCHCECTNKTNCNCDCECSRTCSPYECGTGNCFCNCMP